MDTEDRQVVDKAVAQLLEDNGIQTITSVHCEVPESRRISISPGSRELRADRIKALAARGEL